MEKLVRSLQKDYPDLTFVEGSILCWSPEKKQIYYDPEASKQGISGVLHEIGHARLQHTTYASDIDLVHKEVLAWEEALVLAKKYGISLNADHIQDCLDTYRDWIYKRSTCPACTAKGLQLTREQYTCVNCHNTWHVSNSRFCRPYRLQQETRS